MKISIEQLRRIIKEEVTKERGTGLLGRTDLMRLLSKIAQRRPIPHRSLKPTEQKLVEELKSLGLVRWYLEVDGWTITGEGLDLLAKY